jgi:cytochrome c oxidase assembly factor CtaG
VDRWRIACFGAGAVLVVVALSPPLDRLGDDRLSTHMAQHLVLGDLAALLVALALTGPLLAPVLRRRRLGAIRRLGNPVVALVLWTIDLYVWHLPALYQLALHDDLVHAVQHALFFAFALNMWLPLVGALPVPRWFGQGARLAYVGAVRLAGMALANVLIFSGSALYPHYGALADQRVAGSIMMIEGMVLALALFTWLFFRWNERTEHRQALLDRRITGGAER